MDSLERIKELVKTLNEAAKAYYSEGTEIMTNYEYDKLYDELLQLESETGYVMSDSPTVRVGYEVLSELPKERHEKPMLSLDKTKEPAVLVDWVKNQKALLSWKLDGLTIVLTYENGKLSKAVTRGNGEIGEVITNNAKVFKNVPLTIPYKGTLIVRGEAVITYTDFEKINAEIADESQKYKNPRNLCSGSVRQLNNEITAKRNVNFFAFALVQAQDVDFENSRKKQFDWLAEQGFTVVEHKEVTADTLVETIGWFEKKIETNDFPSDGLVILYDDIAYGDSLGRTAKFPRNAMAFKWTDETKETTLLEIEWSPSRTGLINPVAIFEPVELEGTSVSRASVHNISVMEGLKLGIGDRIEVYKANMIIPQISRNLTESGNVEIPKICPVCGMPTTIQCQNDVKALYCSNPDCQAKHIKSFEHFASRDAMNIDGLSEATLEKFIQMGFLKEFADIFKISRFREQIIGMDGFGEKSYNKLIEALETAKNTTLPKLLYSIGIENIGLSNAKMIVRALQLNLNNLFAVTREELVAVDGVGEVIADSFVSYFESVDNQGKFNRLVELLNIVEEETQQNEGVSGKVFVITGSLNTFENRNALKEYIESQGGKVTGSVTSKTDYLINNDNTSKSSKNVTAAKLGIPVITEEEFLALSGKVD